MSRRLSMPAAFAAALCALAAGPALAGATASASVGTLTWTVLDLKPDDGIAAALVLNNTDSLVRSNVEGAGLNDQDSDAFPVAYTPLSVTSSLSFGTATATVLAGGAQAAATASGPAPGVWGNASADGRPLRASVTIAPWTGLVFELPFALSAATSVGANLEFAYAQATVLLDFPTPGGGTTNDAYRFVSASCIVSGALCGPDAVAASGLITLSYANLSDQPVTAQLYAMAYASGMSAAPVPEPATAAMLLSGLAGVTFLARRRRAG